MAESTLEAALRQFEATEANLRKLEDLWSKIRALIPAGPAFGAPDRYDEYCRAFRHILVAMPAITGTRIEDHLMDFDDIGQMRIDCLEVDEISCTVTTEREIDKQGTALEEYRFALTTNRRQLVRDRILALIDAVDDILRSLPATISSIPIKHPENPEIRHVSDQPEWKHLKNAVSEIGTLLGARPESKNSRWSDLRRHLHFGMVSDYNDIAKMDWPNVKAEILKDSYGEHDPLPISSPDLGELVASKPSGPVSTKLHWANLSDEEFERLLFALLSGTDGYENPQWLQKTHAADRGRDLSVMRVTNDRLGGVRRQRVIIQCKHWQSASIGVPDVATLSAQMKLWEPPRVDELIIASSGRFTADAIDFIEKHNQGDHALLITMWPESHLENLLAAHPHLIAQFRLRQTI